MINENEKERIDFEPNFNINKLSFQNVSKQFEKKFRAAYKNSLEVMSDDNRPFESAAGANTLGILEKMAQQLSSYDKNSDFEQSYHELEKEYEPYTET